MQPDLMIEGRQVASGVMQHDYFDARKVLDGMEWALLKTRESEFVVPDVPVGLVLPVTPELCLVRGQGYRIAGRSLVERLNAFAVRHSRRYFFARSSIGDGGFESTGVSERTPMRWQEVGP